MLIYGIYFAVHDSYPFTTPNRVLVDPVNNTIIEQQGTEQNQKQNTQQENTQN